MATGADLRGVHAMAPAARGATGAQLAQGPQMTRGAQYTEHGDDMPNEIEEAIATVIHAAQAQGFTLPPEGVTQEQLPQVYEQLLQAASQNPQMQTDGGIALIERLARSLGLPSPYGEGSSGGADYVFGGEEPQPFSNSRNQTPVPPGFNRR